MPSGVPLECRITPQSAGHTLQVYPSNMAAPLPHNSAGQHPKVHPSPPRLTQSERLFAIFFEVFGPKLMKKGRCGYQRKEPLLQPLWLAPTKGVAKGAPPPPPPRTFNFCPSQYLNLLVTSRGGAVTFSIFTTFATGA